MTYSVFESKPSVVSYGGMRNGSRLLFITLGVQEKDNGTWEGWQERLPAKDYGNPIVSISGELLLKATEEELAGLSSRLKLDEDLDWWRWLRTVQIRAYDNSQAVNSFLLNGSRMWLDKATRVGLANSIAIERDTGREQTTLWYGSHQFRLHPQLALNILSLVELYALECYNVTASHLAEIEAMGTVEELREYDFRSGYPQPLKIEI